MEGLDVKDDVPNADFPTEDASEAMKLRWVHEWTGFVLPGFCVRGFTKKVSDYDDTHASTVVRILYALIAVDLAMGWSASFCDMSVAFCLIFSLQKDRCALRPTAQFARHFEKTMAMSRVSSKAKRTERKC